MRSASTPFPAIPPRTLPRQQRNDRPRRLRLTVDQQFLQAGGRARRERQLEPRCPAWSPRVPHITRRTRRRRGPIHTGGLSSAGPLRRGDVEGASDYQMKEEAWCREGDLNPHSAKHRRILSPLRLPIPPSRLALQNAGPRLRILVPPARKNRNRPIEYRTGTNSPPRLAGNPCSGGSRRPVQ